MALQKLNAQILEGGLTFDNTGNMTITGNLYATDIGDDDDPIEDFYVSEDSIWIGDQHKVQISSDGKMKFRKRKTTTVPAVIAAAGGTSAGALTHSGKSSLSELKKKHWKLYARSLGGGLASAKNKDIFRDNKADYQQESNADVWQVNDTGEIHSSVNVGIGNADPVSSLHITGTDSLILPVGTTAQRGTATQGALRYNTTTSGFEGYNGTEWGALGGGGLTDEDEDTYITAEATADSDDLDFWTAGTKRMTIDQAGSITVGVDDTGYDVKFFGATTGKYMLWDEDQNKLTVSGDLTVTGTVAGVTATHVGLSSVDNTADADKPISTAKQTALNLKAPIAADVLTKNTHLGWMMGG